MSTHPSSTPEERRREPSVQDLLRLAVDAHGGLRRWEQISRFRAVGSITGAIWDLKGRAQPDGSPARDSISIAVDLSDVAFS